MAGAVAGTALLAVESVGKRFGRREVLKSASLWATAGRISVVVGRNGQGKSTLLKIAAGWLLPDYGVVRVDQAHFQRPRLHELAHLGVFYLPERGLLSPALSIRRHLDAVRHHVPTPSLDEAVERLRVGDLLDQRSGSMSGGEVRRAELAVAVGRSPRCLLADEVYRGITPRDVELVSRVLRDLASEGCAVVIAGQEIDELFDVADDVFWLTAGTTHVLGAPDDARDHHQFRREFLGT